MNTLLLDLRYALRQLRKNPGFAVVAALTLALGIAANSTVFSWIDSTLLDPIPGAAHTDRMLTIQRGERSEHPTPPLSYSDYADLRAGLSSFSGLLAFHSEYAAITGSGHPERVFTALVSANYFDVLGVRAAAGRMLQSPHGDERQSAPEAVLGYDLWRSRYNADPAIVGKTVQINLHNYTVVGVAPASFHGCQSGLRAELFLPLAMDRQVWGWNRMADRGLIWLNVYGVLRPGVSSQAAAQELNLAMERIAVLYPETHQGDNRLSTDPLWRSPFGANVYLSGTLPILLALAAVLLLLACANVANLLLVRSIARRREFAIRLSLGITRARLVRQLLVENLLVALAGGVLAVAITFWTARLLGSFLPSVSLPIDISGHMNGTVLAVAMLVAAVTAVLSGVMPALRASSLSPVSVLKEESLSASGGLKKSRLASTLVAAQVAFSLLLLACAGLFVRSLIKARQVNPGFDPHRVYLASLDLQPLGLSQAQGWELEHAVLERVRALPGVESATLADFSPLSFSIHSDGVQPEGYIARPHESMDADRASVSPGYLATLRTPLVAGREFNSSDTADSQQVVIVNQAFVDRYWPGQNALGKRTQVSGRWYTVVGIAANAKYRRLVSDAAPMAFLPLAQRYQDQVMIHVRTAGSPEAMDAAVRQAVQQIDPNLPVFNTGTLEASMQMGNVFERIVATFAGAFGLLALFLAAIGLYSVIAYTTRQRTAEIGIRMALGADRRDVFLDVLWRGLALTAYGVALGLVVTLAATHFLRGMLYGVGAADWLTFTAVALGLVLVSVVACLIPARRAAALDPMQALHAE
jgi:predicted permease